jgi:hypothetical protein
MSRAVRRSRLGSKRARLRQARDTVLRILELDEQGHSPGAIAASAGTNERHVTRTLFLLGKRDHGPEKEAVAEEGVGGR